MAWDLYVITDEGLSRGLTHGEIARQAVAGGADVIQVRDKTLTGRALYTVSEEIRKVTADAGALFIVNDRLDIALASGADGVHLGQEDLPLLLARKIAPSPFIIGISVASVEEAVDAEQGGADYIAVGPVFSTSSKPDAGPSLGLQVVRDICAAVNKPVIAIGGIHPGNAEDLISAGVEGIAVISAVVSAEDITTAASSFRHQIRGWKNVG